MTQPNPYILAAENPSALLTLLRSNPAIASCQDEHGYSLLHAAASYGHADLLRALVREFNVDYNKRNDEGLTAQETIENDGAFPDVAAYLAKVMGISPSAPAGSSLDALNAPPPLPPNIRVNLGTVSEEEASAGMDQVDPEFKRRIDELAAREDFHSEATQNQLRQLVMDALNGSNIETQDRDVRRRTE
jgi:hypothetical protein